MAFLLENKVVRRRIYLKEIIPGKVHRSCMFRIYNTEEDAEISLERLAQMALDLNSQGQCKVNMFRMEFSYLLYRCLYVMGYPVHKNYTYNQRLELLHWALKNGEH